MCLSGTTCLNVNKHCKDHIKRVGPVQRGHHRLSIFQEFEDTKRVIRIH